MADFSDAALWFNRQGLAEVDRRAEAAFHIPIVALMEELLSNVVDRQNQAADFLTPFSNLIPANTSGINSEPLSL